MKKALLILSAFIIGISSYAQRKGAVESKPSSGLESSVFDGLSFRFLGPAINSGRVVDFAVNPASPKEYFVAVASGGVWKTNNAGITYEPVFDQQGSYSIGCVTMDPSNSNIVWVGTGENNNQRSVAYGDGVYKSEDGGKSWKNMGLKKSEHIGMIKVHPSNSEIVYVAAYGPLWSSGGDRGIYKTTDGGKTWKAILTVSEYTGFNEIHLDPRNSDVLYATAHQRMRHVFTYISGGPESAVYKSIDGGNTWNKIHNGLPTVDLGRIGLAISPVNPDYIYAIVEAADKKGGVFRSTDRGASWQKRGDFTTTGNYYQEIFCDPVDIEKVYCMDFWVMVSKDGGKSFDKIGEMYKHVDNHAIWIDPTDTRHLLVGCDGGIYETFDNGANWEYKANLPVTQFYKVSVDDASPFYRVYGGTQDNNSMSGPSRTTSGNGISNYDWYFTLEGDGFESANDPKDPNIAYVQAQYGVLARYDKKSMEVVYIKPVEDEGEPGLRWNWDSPLIISNHLHTRIYFGANKLFRSDDRGDTWTAISGDLSRQIDRNKLPVMGRVWGMDAVAKNTSTDIYGNLVSIAESYFDENTLMVGTDDGLIHVTNDGGKNWQRLSSIPGVPDRTYVNQIIASQHDKNTFYACFNHHRYGDFRPYLYKTRDGGKTWSAIHSNLPDRGSVYSIAEDHVKSDLLFAGTEFGVFCSVDGGQSWNQLKSGLPVISVRDLAIQKRESDLVLGTFGRGIYILDDYSPLRHITRDELNKEAVVFPVKDSWMFVEGRPWGAPLKGFFGESFFSVPNPPVGATFTYHLKNDLKTIKEIRKEKEAELVKKGLPVYYPSPDSIRMEDRQPAPFLIFTIKDDQGRVVRNIKADAKKGLKRITWDFRYAAPGAVTFYVPDPTNPYDSPENGHLAMPGTYTVTLSKFENGKITELTGPRNFVIKSLNAATLAATDKKALDDFSRKIAELRRSAAGADQYISELKNKIKHVKVALIDVPSLLPEVASKLYNIEQKLHETEVIMNGDASMARREFETAPSINSRIGIMEYTVWNSTQAPSNTFRKSHEIASRQFEKVLKDLKQVHQDFREIEKTLEQHKAPYTPGRLPWVD
ncbi:MAG: glycosyl hydrolase [Bacteroidetes bacterium]|nr:MAG: glycosyl hydrolase [Bacteroidota bacterium]REK36309.1 MAG: glycosyl hydrolase [Bacteroidota bacterium]REK51025.1 MAG: glycosyl hydrolase [Bacteroidota bacterium]